MITKEQLAASLTRECDVIQHVFTKLDPSAASYRPGPGQRSTLELLRYISYCASGAIRSLEAKDWSVYNACKVESEGLELAGFPAAMDRQKSDIEAFFAEVSEAELESTMTKMPGGGVVSLGLGILNGPLKWLVAYKMQLFLYAKATGATEIGTANLWGGADRAPQPKPAS